MKLPTDKKERMKVFLMIGIGVALVLFVGIFYGIAPVLKSRSDTQAKILELKAQLDQAVKESKQSQPDIAKSREALLKLKNISEKYLLRPILNSYVLPAQDVIETEAKKLGIKAAVTEVSLGEIPGRQSTKTKAYTAHVALECGYNQFIKLVQRIEAANPYFCITAISITGQPAKDPRRHSITFDIQWPTWVDLEMPDKLDAQLEKLNETSRLIERDVTGHK
jgi:hypothetical protein